MSQYLIDGQVREQSFLSTLFPNLSWDWGVELPQHLIDHLALVPVQHTQKPQADTNCKVEPDGYSIINNIAIEQWKQTLLTPEEVQANALRKVDEITKAIVQATQDQLDDFARTRNYDGILSACTYATSAVPKFYSEGARCIAARDATWAALYAFMAAVKAGTRPMPSSFADVETELPKLTWGDE